MNTKPRRIYLTTHNIRIQVIFLNLAEEWAISEEKIYANTPTLGSYLIPKELLDKLEVNRDHQPSEDDLHHLNNLNDPKLSKNAYLGNMNISTDKTYIYISDGEA